MAGQTQLFLQSGAFREAYAVDANEISLKSLRETACEFIKSKYPLHTYGDAVEEHILLYRHDLRSINILQLITTTAEICDGTMIEVVMSTSPQGERVVVHPHTLFVHSYKVPTFCDFCGEMLFGLVKQGLKCQGCGLNYHKRCASKIPNNCSGSRQRRPSAIPLSPRSSVGLSGKPSNLPGGATSTPQNVPLSPTPSAGCPRPSPSTSVLNTPDIYITGEEDSCSITGEKNTLLTPMPRKDRSSSWSGRPLWMEVADATRVKVPHTFQVHSYTRPTVCQLCKKLLKGLLRQGLQCRDCKYNCHKKCEVQVAKDCPGGSVSRSPSFFLGADSPGDGGIGSSMETSNSFSLEDDSEDRTSECPPSPIAKRREPGDSANIPLMRIVMSKKQTKRPTSKVLREGWVVHYTSQNNMRKKHYWRLDTKNLTMYHDEISNRYFKEVPLSDILGIKSSKENVSEHEPLKESQTHYFEVKTSTCTFYIAPATPLIERNQWDTAVVWETSLRHALMPVTPQNSTGSNAMASLKVPVPGDTGHLGVQIQSEKEFSQLYQIFADEILGSGQFGTVYGGIRRKTGDKVAVKVIDKLKFPSNKEAALRVEVDILQTVGHPGVVGFEQMLETLDRIFVVMEKLEGDMLEMILSSERGRLAERNTKFLVHQILISLRYLHQQNIVHCDLKPENILLATTSDFPQIKLCDFGFARIIGERSFRRSVVGTPAYLAPEVLRNKGFNRSLDMWSVGVIVYVSLSGTFPFNEDEDINDQIQNAEFMYPPSPWREISADAVDFINSLLQVKMSKRLTVNKALSHIWMQGYDLWSDLRKLEIEFGERYLTHESDDTRWKDYEKEHEINPQY